MSLLARVHQKIFGSTGATGEFGKFGSDSLGSPATTKDLTLIQSLSPYDAGLFAATNNANEPPRIQDLNGLYLLFSSQIAYILQNGIPEWSEDADYYALVSFVSDGAGGIYRALQNSTSAAAKPPLTDPTYWALISDAVDSPSIKNAIEYGKGVGEIFTRPERKVPAAFAKATPVTYFPELCLTDFDIYKDIAVANWPRLQPYLYGLKTIFKDGLTGELAALGVTNWVIAANVATLTFTNDADHIAALSDLLEDQVQHGSYTNWRSTTIPTIGNITAGTYALTNVNPSTRQISFAFVAGNASGSVTSSAEFYAHRVPGSTTTARVFSAKGLSLMGVNDANGYFVSGSLRRRGFTQGHAHSFSVYSANPGGAINWPTVNTNQTNTVNVSGISLPSNDGTNSTPRIAKETHSPAVSVHIYQHGGSYVA